MNCNFFCKDTWNFRSYMQYELPNIIVILLYIFCLSSLMVADVLIYCLSLGCRPGRLEVQIEISLPDENGRIQILQIHTNKMKESSFLAPDVNLQELGTCIIGICFPYTYSSVT